MAKRKNFSVKAFVEWLNSMPADKEYDWSDASNCLIGQWCKSQGLDGDKLHDKSCELGQEDAFYEIALVDMRHCTFGAALRRASKLTSNHRATE